MKQHIVATVLLLALSSSLPAQATGIPTVDVAAAIELKANAAAQVTQALDALKQAKAGIDQARQQYENYKGIVTGNDKLGNFLDNPALNTVLPMGDWAEIYDTAKDINRLRLQYGLQSDDATVQAKFDRMISTAEALERVYDSTTDRVKNAEEMRVLLNQVQTPQQKADLQLRYQQELLEQQNQQMRLTNMHMLAEQQERMENRKRAQEYTDNLLR